MEEVVAPKNSRGDEVVGMMEGKRKNGVLAVELLLFVFFFV